MTKELPPMGAAHPGFEATQRMAEASPIFLTM